jgi:glutamate 5-kinase
MGARRGLTRARRLVVKVGSGLITSPGEGLDAKRIRALAGDIAALVAERREVALVSSGAIAAGIARLGLTSRPRSIPEKQAAAAVGQSALMWHYEQAFKRHGIKVGQVLLTSQDISDRGRYLNARNTLLALLDFGVLPIVNENDTVAVDEIKFGDNDNLSGMVVQLTDADLLIILSDIDGLYTADPRLHPDARFIPVVEKITAEMERGAGDALFGVGTGGMRSKIMAAKKVGAYGVPLVILNGKKPGLLAALFDGRETGTLFLPRLEKMDSRKHWIAYTAASKGGIVVDDGGRDALVHKGKSLLPGGVVSVEGTFKVGDCVNCLDLRGSVFARGLTKYSSLDLDRIRGLKTSQIEPVLGHKDYDEVIHRDDLVIL